MSWLIFSRKFFGYDFRNLQKKPATWTPDRWDLSEKSVRLGGGSDLSWLQAYSNDQGLNEAPGGGGGNGHFFNDFCCYMIGRNT